MAGLVQKRAPKSTPYAGNERRKLCTVLRRQRKEISEAYSIPERPKFNIITKVLDTPEEQF